jgi:hypothetical protein
MPKNPLVRMLMMAVVGAWVVYDMATATEAPSRALEILHYVLLACLLIGLIGTGIQLAAQKSGGEGG